MEWAWILIALEYVLLGAALLKAIFLVMREMSGKEIEKRMNSFHKDRVAKIKAKSGIDISEVNLVDSICKHLKVNVHYRDNEYQKLKKLYRLINKAIKKSKIETNAHVIVSLYHNLIGVKNHLTWNKDMKEVPSLSEVMMLMENKLDISRVIKLYIGGLTPKDMIETKNIAEAHAIALYS